MKKLLVVLVVGLFVGSPAMVRGQGAGGAGAGGAIGSALGWSTITSYEATTQEKPSAPDEEPSAYVQQQVFVAMSIDNLKADIAQGGGPHLQSLSRLLGCPASDYPTLADMARRDFGRLFPTTETTSADFLARLKDDISRDPRLSESCIHLKERPADEDPIQSVMEPDRIQSVMEPATHDVAGAGPPVLREGKEAKLAIFPEILVGDSPEQADIESSKLAARISRQIAKHPGSIYVAYSYLELPKEEHAALRGSVWRTGMASARPNIDGVRSRGQALGVDVVMQVLIRTDEIGSFGVYETNHEVHVVDVKSGQHFMIIRTSSPNVLGWDLLNEMDSTIGEAIEKYKRIARSR